MRGLIGAFLDPDFAPNELSLLGWIEWTFEGSKCLKSKKWWLKSNALFCTISLLEKYYSICRSFGGRFSRVVWWADKLPNEAIRTDIFFSILLCRVASFFYT